MSRFRNVCFTINNPEAPVEFSEEYMQYLTYQKERGESGTPHYQGYVEFTKQLSLKKVKQLLGASAHVEARRGSQEQAIAYCHKEESRIEDPVTHGEPRNQGQRTDVAALVEVARTGAPKRQALEQCPATYARYYKAYEHIASLTKPERKDRRVHLLLGAPGTGKTRYVLDKHPDCYVIPVTNSSIWFDGYDGHEVVLIDDYMGQFPLIQFLRLLHEYPEQVPVKGGHVWFNPSVIYVTSNYQINEWYKFEGREASLAALERRFHEIRVFPEENEE